MNSFNHYAYGACSEWMFRSMLGIDTDGPGFKKITMKPELGEGVTWAKGHYDSIRGRISSNWKLEGKFFHWEITTPPNTSATVYIPSADKAKITLDGEPIDEVEGVKFLRMENDRAVIQVSAGTFRISSEVANMVE